MQPDLTVVTPWWGKRELERDYWKAIAAANVPVLVIDNGSDPPLPNGVRLYDNSGFSHACNVGLWLVQTSAVLFLNNDIAATAADWLDPILEALEPGVLVGAQLRNDPHGDVDGVPMPYLDGWCLAGMTDELRELGGWDESYDEPSYFGDNDLSLRARAAGMTLREARVPLHHKLNQTAGHGPRVTAATLANRRRFEFKARELIGA